MMMRSAFSVLLISAAVLACGSPMTREDPQLVVDDIFTAHRHDAPVEAVVDFSQRTECEVDLPESAEADGATPVPVWRVAMEVPDYLHPSLSAGSTWLFGVDDRFDGDSVQRASLFWAGPWGGDASIVCAGEAAVVGQLVFKGEIRSPGPEFDVAWPPQDEARNRAAALVEQNGLQEVLDAEVTAALPSCDVVPEHDACVE